MFDGTILGTEIRKLLAALLGIRTEPEPVQATVHLTVTVQPKRPEGDR